MKNLILLFTYLIFINLLSAQQITDLQALQKALAINEVYTPEKNYKYQVTKLDANKDTISTEIINMRIPSELNTKTYDDGKVYFIWEYNSHSKYKAQLSALSKPYNEKDWMTADTTTLRFNDQDLYIHPMRENQYYQAEVAAHPTIEFDHLQNGKYNSKIVILKGFGKYNMQEFTSEYEVKGKEDFELNGETLNCYKIMAGTKVKAFSFGSAKGDKIGVFGDKEIINTTTFWVNEAFGFVKIFYQFYDGEELLLEMIK